ncbi:MAG: extracellular solute-binding protein [Actinomycetota bacterium]
MRRSKLPVAIVLLLSLLGPACRVADNSEKVVRVYSGRHYGEEAAFEQFSKESGISVEFLFGSDAELRERIKAEGENTLADVYMTVDAGNLYLAAEEGVFQPVQSQVLNVAIPENLRDPSGQWYGLSLRARTLVYNPAVVDPDELTTYEALGDPKWRDRLCMRDSSNVYTQSMVASLIAHHGNDEAAKIVKSWVANDVDILGSDVLVLKTIAKGGCDVGLTNHYYLGRLLQEDGAFPVKLAWADQQGRGAHVNVSGAGVTKHADNPDLAVELIEWLATRGQNVFVDSNHEYPANPLVRPEPLIANEFGTDFKKDVLNAAEFGSLNADAVRIMDQAGYE